MSKQPVPDKQKKVNPTKSSKQPVLVKKKQGQPRLSDSESSKQPVPVKKKQGRPRLSESGSSKQPVQVKQKQGRPQLSDSEMKKPRKSPKPKFVNKTVASEVGVDSESDSSSLTQQVAAAVALNKDDAVDSMELNQSEDKKSEKEPSKETKTPTPIMENSKGSLLAATAAADEISVDDQLDKSSPQERTKENRASASPQERTKEDRASASKLASKHGKAPARQVNSFMRYSSRIAVRQLESACPEDAMAVQETLESMETDTPTKEIQKRSREVRNLSNMFPLPSKPRSRIQSVSENKQEVGQEKTRIKKSVKKKKRAESREIAEVNEETQPVSAVATEKQDHKLEQQEKQKQAHRPELEQKQHQSVVGTIQATACGELYLDDRSRSLEISPKLKKPERMNACIPSNAITPSKLKAVSPPVSTVPLTNSGATSTVACVSPTVLTSSVRDVVPVPALITERDDVSTFNERKCQGRRNSKHGKKIQTGDHLYRRRRYFKSRWENGGERCVTVGGSGGSMDPRCARPLMQQTNCPILHVDMDVGIELQHSMPIMENIGSAIQSHQPVPFKETTEFVRQTYLTAPLMENVDYHQHPMPMNINMESAMLTRYPHPSMNHEFAPHRNVTPVSCGFVEQPHNLNPSVFGQYSSGGPLSEEQSYSGYSASYPVADHSPAPHRNVTPVSCGFEQPYNLNPPVFGQYSSGGPLSEEQSYSGYSASYPVADHSPWVFDSNGPVTKSPNMTDGRWPDNLAAPHLMKTERLVTDSPVSSSIVGDAPVDQVSPGDRKEPSPLKPKKISLRSYWETRRAEKSHNSEQDGENTKAGDVSMKTNNDGVDMQEHEHERSDRDTGLVHPQKSLQMTEKQLHSNQGKLLSKDQQQVRPSEVISPLSWVGSPPPPPPPPPPPLPPPAGAVNSPCRPRPPPPPPPPPPLSLKSPSTPGSGLKLGDKEHSKVKSLHLDGKAQTQHQCELFQTRPNASPTHEDGSPTEMIFGIPVSLSVAKMVKSALPFRVRHSGGRTNRTEEKCADGSPNKIQKSETAVGVEAGSPGKEQHAIVTSEGTLITQQNTTSSLEPLPFVDDKLTNSSSGGTLPLSSEQQTTRAQETTGNDEAMQKTMNSLELPSPFPVEAFIEQKLTIGGDVALDESNQNAVVDSLEGLVPVGDSTNTENVSGIPVVKQENVADYLSGVPSGCEPNTTESLEAISPAEPLHTTKSLGVITATSEPKATHTLPEVPSLAPVSEPRTTDSFKAIFQVSEQRKAPTTLKAMPSVSKVKTVDVVEEAPAPVTSPLSQQKTTDSLQEMPSSIEQMTKTELEETKPAFDEEKSTNSLEPEPISAYCEQIPTDGLEPVSILNDEKTLYSLEAVPLATEEINDYMEPGILEPRSLVVNQNTQDSVEEIPTFSKQQQNSLATAPLDNGQKMCDSLQAITVANDSAAYIRPESLSLDGSDCEGTVRLLDHTDSPIGDLVSITDSDEDYRHSSVFKPSTEDANKDEKTQKVPVTPHHRRLVDSDYGSTPESEKESFEEKSDDPVASGLLSLADAACRQHKEPIDGHDVTQESDCDYTIDTDDSIKIDIKTGSIQFPVTLSKSLDGQPSDTTSSETVEPRHSEDNHRALVPQCLTRERRTRTREQDRNTGLDHRQTRGDSTCDQKKVKSVSSSCVPSSNRARSSSRTARTDSERASSASSKRKHVQDNDERTEDTPSKKRRYTQAGALSKLRSEEERLKSPSEPASRSSRNQWRQLPSEQTEERSRETAHGVERPTLHTFVMQSRRKPRREHRGVESSDSDQDKAAENRSWRRSYVSSEHAHVQVKRRLFEDYWSNDRERKSTSKERDSKEPPRDRRRNADSERSSAWSRDGYADHHGNCGDRLQRRGLVGQHREHPDVYQDKPDSYRSMSQDGGRSPSKRRKSRQSDEMETMQRRSPIRFRVRPTDRRYLDGAIRELRSSHAHSAWSEGQMEKSRFRRCDLRNSDRGTAGKR